MIIDRKTQHYIDIVLVLIQKELKVRYKSSFLGYIWSIANPLAFALIFYVVFKVIMKIKMPDYALFVVAGLFPWQWFSNSASFAPMVFLSNASMIKKVNFPRNIIPLTMVLQDMIHFILAIPVIFFLMFLYHRVPSPALIWGIPVLLCIQLLMTYGIALIISSVNLFFRDLERLTTILMMFVFYATPVVYSETMVPERYRYLLNLNPLAPLIISWRSLFLEGRIDPVLLVICMVYGIGIFIGGHLVYKKLSWRFAEVL